MKRSFLVLVMLARPWLSNATVPSEKMLERHDCYENKYHHPRHVPSPSRGVPEGATARCRDGAYSFSEHRSGTCSGHQGVDQWMVRR
jgi:hypothetical protein